MVERPIKKSQLQAITESNNVVEAAQETEPSTIEGAIDSITQSSQERNTTQPPLKKDKTKGKGRGDRHNEQSNRPPANAALMRGPKPTKPKPPVIQAPQAASESDSSTEAAQEET